MARAADLMMKRWSLDERPSNRELAGMLRDAYPSVSWRIVGRFWVAGSIDRQRAFTATTATNAGGWYVKLDLDFQAYGSVLGAWHGLDHFEAWLAKVRAAIGRSRVEAGQ